MKVLIALPTNRGFLPQTFECLAEMIEFSKHKELEIAVLEEGYTVAENRNYCAVQACNSGADFLLMIDDDMTFDPNILETLVHNDKDICGVSYKPRANNGVINAKLDGKVIKEDYFDDITDITEVDAIGTGIILIKTDVLKKIPQPWFFFEQYENGCTKLGEDWAFCKKAKQHNYKIHLDPTLKIGHLGEVTY